MTARAHLDQLLTDPANPTVGLGREGAVVFCGDLNDEPAAATTQIVAGPTGSEIDLTPGRPSNGPTPTMGFGCGTWPRCCHQISASRGSSRAERS
jgi:endonuclease/exonuclease/phosphatase family metal-dependent hydrolase